MRAINAVVVMLYYEAMTTFGGSKTADQNPRDVGTQETRQIGTQCDHIIAAGNIQPCE
jgi:hypothetical protein